MHYGPPRKREFGPTSTALSARIRGTPTLTPRHHLPDAGSQRLRPCGRSAGCQGRTCTPAPHGVRAGRSAIGKDARMASTPATALLACVRRRAQSESRMRCRAWRLGGRIASERARLASCECEHDGRATRTPLAVGARRRRTCPITLPARLLVATDGRRTGQACQPPYPYPPRVKLPREGAAAILAPADAPRLCAAAAHNHVSPPRLGKDIVSQGRFFYFVSQRPSCSARRGQGERVRYWVRSNHS